MYVYLRTHDYYSLKLLSYGTAQAQRRTRAQVSICMH